MTEAVGAIRVQQQKQTTQEKMPRRRYYERSWEPQSTELMHGLRYRDADGTSVQRNADGEATASFSPTTQVEAATRRQAMEQHRAGTTLAAEQRDTRDVIRAPFFTFTFRLLSPPPAFRRVNFGPRFLGDRLGSASTTQGSFDDQDGHFLFNHPERGTNPLPRHAQPLLLLFKSNPPK